MAIGCRLFEAEEFVRCLLAATALTEFNEQVNRRRRELLDEFYDGERIAKEPESEENPESKPDKSTAGESRQHAQNSLDSATSKTDTADE